MQEPPLHEADAMPLETLAALVIQTTGRVATALEPLAQGEATAAYRVTTQEGGGLIVRVQKRGVTGFAEEAWAMRRCREVGLPVPEVYGVSQVGTDAPRDAMVMAAARGRPLAEVMASLSQAELARVSAEVGKALRKLHEIPVPHYGWLRRDESDESGAGTDWTAFAQTLLAARKEDAPALEKAGLSRAEVEGLLDIVLGLQDLPYARPVLCHGDLGADHLFVDDDLNLVDIIDFGMAQGGAPALDVGVLRMFHPEVELAWLAEGYGGAPLSEGGFGREVLLHQVNVGMMHLAESMRRGDESFKDIAVFGLRSWLERWRGLSG